MLKEVKNVPEALILHPCMSQCLFLVGHQVLGVVYLELPLMNFCISINSSLYFNYIFVLYPKCIMKSFISKCDYLKKL